ncbi:hypothetical protein RYX36_000717 [Vicia faba]
MWCPDIGREQATKFAEIWVPFCKKYNVQRRAPFRYFCDEAVDNKDFPEFKQDRLKMKEEYEQLSSKIKNAAEKSIPCQVMGEFAVFSQTQVKNHQTIIKVIQRNKDLDLPAHKVMVATVRYEEIANEKYAAFVANEEWCQLEETVQSNPIPGFGKKINSLLHAGLSEYDVEATYFDEGVRTAKQKQLQDKLLQLVQPTYQSTLGHIKSGTLEKFKDSLEKALKGGEKQAHINIPKGKKSSVV